MGTKAVVTLASGRSVGWHFGLGDAERTKSLRRDAWAGRGRSGQARYSLTEDVPTGTPAGAVGWITSLASSPENLCW